MSAAMVGPRRPEHPMDRFREEIGRLPLAPNRPGGSEAGGQVGQVSR